MKKIHFYKETKLIYSVWANDIQDVKLSPLDYYENYTNDLVISDIEYNHPILEGRSLREMTREEMIAQGIHIELNDGEVVVNKKLITTPKPSKWHKWINGEWTVNLEEIKEETRNKFKKELEEKRYSHFKYEGNIYQMGKADIPNFEKIKMALDILKQFDDVDTILNLLEHLDSNLVTKVREQKEKIPNFSKENLLKLLENYKTKWRLVDNSMVEITYNKVKEILLAFIFRDGALNNQYNKINEKLLNATSLEEIEAIVWEE